MIYNIFGRNVKIEFEDKTIEKFLHDWVKHYPEGDGQVDVDIKFVKKIPRLQGIFYSSPASYVVYDNASLMNIGKHKVLFQKEDKKLNIYIQYYYHSNPLKEFLVKFRNIGFFSTLENVGAFFHEMVLVLMQYVLDDKMLIHSSAVKNLNTNEVILFGGSGGVGKTSLELLLCNELNYSFIADDISVVDKEGFVYPNLAYPKIYAYNTFNNEKIKDIIFENRGPVDKFQWKIRRMVKGDKGVRRAVSPFRLYKNVETRRQKINSYYLLQRTNKVEKIKITPLDKDTASYATYLIIKNEYGVATLHFGWSEYNTLFDERINPIVSLDKVYEQWKRDFNSLFNRINTYLIEIPVDINHNEFIKFFKGYFQG